MSTVPPQHQSAGRLVSVPVVRAKGCGGAQSDQPLYEAHIDGKPYVLWELEDQRVACTSAVCPHKPVLGPILNIRGIVEGNDLRCMHHANLYSGISGECVQVMGQRDPGRMRIFYGHRDGNTFVIHIPSAM